MLVSMEPTDRIVCANVARLPIANTPPRIALTEAGPRISFKHVAPGELPGFIPDGSRHVCENTWREALTEPARERRAGARKQQARQRKAARKRASASRRTNR